MKYKRKQLNRVTMEKIMHQTNNKGQSCQQPKLHEFYAKKYLTTNV